MSMMVSFVLSFFPLDVLDEILNLIESVSEDFPSYSSNDEAVSPLIGAPVAQWVKRWPTDLADRVRSSLEVKSSQP